MSAETGGGEWWQVLGGCSSLSTVPVRFSLKLTFYKLTMKVEKKVAKKTFQIPLKLLVKLLVPLSTLCNT